MAKLKLLGLIVLMGVGQPLLAQEDIFKDYAESHSDRRYCLYPSTLRMINIDRNKAFDELASSLDKFLIYDLDSVSTADKSFFEMTDKFREEGFEEYISITGAGNEVLILGKEKRVNELVGVMGVDNEMYAFFLKGNVAWQKIPEIMNTLSSDGLLNVLNMQSERWE